MFLRDAARIDFNKVFNPDLSHTLKIPPSYLRAFMGLKGNKLYSIFTFTCPRCHEGKLFKHRRTYAKGFTELNKKCAVCKEDFEREPGFYFGAAYVSYALTVALWVALYVALTVFDLIGLMEFSFFDDGILFLVTGVILLILLLPLIYRFSRVIWINFFVKYRKDAIEFNQKREEERMARKARRGSNKQEDY